MMKNIMTWITRITTFLLLTALLSMIFIVVSTKANGSVFGYQLKNVLSGSMEPGIQTGSIIVVQKPDDVNNFQKGDIVTFILQDYGFVTHRVHEVKNNGEQYVTKGDSNAAPDPEPLLADNIVAAYTGFTIPYLGYAITYFSAKEKTALLFIVPGLLLFISSGVSIWKILRDVEGKHERSVISKNS